MGAERTVLEWEGGVRKSDTSSLDAQSTKVNLPASNTTPFVFNFSMAIVVWFLTVLLASIWVVKYPAIVLLFYVFFSAITYSFYMFDSAAAKQNTLRVHHGILHTLSLVGGWPGALVAQCSYKVHYHNKIFAVLFWCTVGVNLLAYVWTFTDIGNAYLLSCVRELKLWFSPI